MEIKVDYNGCYPTLCSGQLFITVKGKRWEFPYHALSSGGSAYFDDDYDEVLLEGAWTITKYPEGFPKELESIVESKVNEVIPHGCCGGCF